MIGTAAGPARQARLSLLPGLTLFEAVSGAMAALSWRSATLQLLGGPLARAVFVCSVLTPNGPRWIDYGPRRDAGPCWLALGSATFGLALDGGLALHAHGLLADDACLAQGGHLIPEETIIGGEGLTAHAVSGAAAGFAITRDPSGFNLLAPHAA